ncbi:MAG: 16S rRNA (cytidine(1402)-2'-O)-methyltransferase [Bacteroidetes bacterium]|nr:16S rRNA (cytidine(1402)-2'-O)-methyltransferase [Bacteroidota bacterium]
MSAGKLYLVATPIGNLGDISFRAVDILKQADRILAEDTRTSSVLCKHYQINTRLESFHQHNEHQKLNGLLRELEEGAIIAQISDAGTPGISDPGFLLTRACLEKNIPVEIIPGAAAFIPALLKSGFALHRFVFEGFLPQKKGRQTRLLELVNDVRTTCFYESPHKLLKTLQQLAELAGLNRRISVSREITKKFEQTITGSLNEVIQHFTSHAPKGEFVVVLEGFGAGQNTESESDENS